MKRALIFKLLPFFMVLLTAVLIISSCKKDEEVVETPNPPPPPVTGEQMPNGGMDVWVDQGLGFENPEDWQTSNAATAILQIYTTTKSTDAIQGAFSAKLETIMGNTPGRAR